MEPNNSAKKTTPHFIENRTKVHNSLYREPNSGHEKIQKIIQQFIKTTKVPYNSKRRHYTENQTAIHTTLQRESRNIS